nr:N-6 DNA methylase [Nodosilinea sp. LEGE 07088]
MEEANRLYLVVSSFAEIDLYPNRVDNITMGLVFEDLIRRFNELANETARDHFTTPREVIHLMVNLLMEPDGDVLTGGSPIVTVCDPACGTGGMLVELSLFGSILRDDFRPTGDPLAMLTFSMSAPPKPATASNFLSCKPS